MIKDCLSRNFTTEDHFIIYKGQTRNSYFQFFVGLEVDGTITFQGKLILILSQSISVEEYD